MVMLVNYGGGMFVVLQLAASLERYSKRKLAAPILDAAHAARIALLEAAEVSERPGARP